MCGAATVAGSNNWQQTLAASTATTEIPSPATTLTDKATTTSTSTTESTAISGAKFVSFFNRALSFIDSASIYIEPISNVLFGFMLVKMLIIENDRGCKLPNGLKVENGWHELSSDCQEECFCMKNEFDCLPKSCDLKENQCVLDAFGKNFCYRIDSSVGFESECSCENLNCTEHDTTIAPTTSITTTTGITPTSAITTITTITPMAEPYVQIDGIIDIKANQSVGTIDKYYMDFEMSFEIKLSNLTLDKQFGESSITGQFEKYNSP